MNYAQFINSKGLELRLFNLLKIRNARTFIVEIDHNPDYDLTPYKREVGSDYIFRHHCHIPDEFSVMFHVEITRCVIFFDEQIAEMARQAHVPYQEDRVSLLNRAFSVAPDLLEEYCFEPGTDEFRLYEIRSAEIDNERRRIYYEGSFFGDSASIDPLDWKLYAVMEGEGLSPGQEFYKSLIAESHTLKLEGKFNLSYFLLHAAFESFVNFELDAYEEKERLTDSVSRLYRMVFGDISKHQIYCTLKGKLDPFSKKRNNIAHGRGGLSISSAQLDDSFLFVLIMIGSYNYNCTTFSNLRHIMEQQEGSNGLSDRT